MSLNTPYVWDGTTDFCVFLTLISIHVLEKESQVESWSNEWAQEGGWLHFVSGDAIRVEDGLVQYLFLAFLKWTPHTIQRRGGGKYSGYESNAYGELQV